MRDYEEDIETVKRVLFTHTRVGTHEVCWCGWRSGWKGNTPYSFNDHLAALIALEFRK